MPVYFIFLHTTRPINLST